MTPHKKLFEMLFLATFDENFLILQKIWEAYYSMKNFC